MSNEIKLPATLIATLGSEPQVVTAALDLLLQRGEPITRTVVIHTFGPGTIISAAVERLQGVFNKTYKETGVCLELEAILDERGFPFSDVETHAAAQAAFRTIYKQVHKAKLRGDRVHLSIAGGRKTMAVFGMSTAQLLFDENDHL